MILHQYKIYCQTSAKFEFTDFRDSTLPQPTTCPVDTNHVCSLDSVTIHKTLDLSEVKTQVTSIPASASKTLTDGKKLYKRVHGTRNDVIAGSNVIDWVVPHPHVKFQAIEFFEAEAGEYVELEIYDTATGTYSGVANAKLNQFGFSANVGKGFYSHRSEFDADLYQGMIVKITYSSKSAKNVGINYIMSEVKA